MSTFLGYEAYLVALGSSIADMQGVFISTLTSYGWRVVKKSLVPQSLIGSMTNLARAFDNSVVRWSPHTLHQSSPSVCSDHRFGGCGVFS